MKTGSISSPKFYGYLAVIVIGFGVLAWGAVRVFVSNDDPVADDIQRQADEIAERIRAQEPPPGTRPDELEPEEAPPPPDNGPKSLRGG